VADVRFHVNWQWPAIEMQYERLMKRSQLPLGRQMFERILMIADMDFPHNYGTSLPANSGAGQANTI
jgi:hypothetical protein